MNNLNQICLLILISTVCSISSTLKPLSKKEDLLETPANHLSCYITYSFSGGRLGDNIIAFLRAFYLSEKYLIPLLYNKFQFSDKLLLHKSIPPKTTYLKKKLKKITIKKSTSLLQAPQKNSLYTAQYIGDLSERETLVEFFWANTSSITKKIKQLISPLKQIQKIALPNDTVNIAVHIRKGSGRDTGVISDQLYKELPFDTQNDTKNPYRKKYSDEASPLKFPPEQYYIDQILLLSELYNNKKLYIYLFTDYSKPQELAKKFYEHLSKVSSNDKITIEANNKDSSSDCNSILNDFFNIGKFDILVRPDSNFSLCAQAIGENKIVIRPNKYHWEERRLIIDSSIAMVRMNNEVRKFLLPSQKEKLFQTIEKRKAINYR